MKSKWKRRKHPRPSKQTIRGNSRQMWRTQIQNMIAEEEAEYGPGYGVSAFSADRDGKTLAA